MDTCVPQIWRRIRQCYSWILINSRIKYLVRQWMVQRYHGYLLTDRTDGAIFDPKKSTAIDLTMHMSRNGCDYIDDSKWSAMFWKSRR
jgi:hypothetical protein